jgi:hypothetical protein
VDENARKPASAAIAVASLAVLPNFKRFCMSAASSYWIESIDSDHEFICGHGALLSVPIRFEKKQYDAERNLPIGYSP